MTDRSNLRDAQVLGALEAELGLDARPHGARSPSAEDARLAELARIVGQNDRFRDLLRTPLSSPRPAEPVAGQGYATRQEPHFDPAPQPQWDAAAVEEAGRLHAYTAQPAAASQWASEPQWEQPAAHASGQGADASWAGQPAHAGDAYGYQGAQGYAAHGQAEPAYAQDYAGSYADAAPAAGFAAAAPVAARGFDGDRHAQGYAPAPDPLRALEGARLRRRKPARAPLLAAAAVIAVCASASAGYFMLGQGGGSTGAGGEAPIIRADASPVKVAPPVENTADPAATKEIYEQLAKPSANTRVVANNEQPVDVEQTLRQQRAAAVAAGRLPSEVAAEDVSFGAGKVVPLPTPGGNRDPREGLGEPKRVRTVSIGPDGKVRQQQVAATPSAMPAATPPARPVAVAAAPKQEHRVPSTMVDSTPTGSVGGVDAPVAQREPKPVKVAAAPAATPATSAAPVGRGGFAVQLGAPGSEEEARKLAASLKRKYNVLAAHSTAVVKAQSNGRTIYRLRVPGLSRDSANSLCAQLKSSGGSCFVAQG